MTGPEAGVGRGDREVLVDRDVLVDVQDATRTHGTVQVLGPTSFRLRSGEAAVVVGPNGSGKSTLLRLVAGVDQPTSGTALTFGRPAQESRLRRRQDIALLLNGLPTYQDLTVAEHLKLVSVAWAGRHQGPPVEEALAESGLERVRDQFPGELSSGEGQLFALVTTLYRPARLVILDEPEQRLDAAWRDAARRLLGRALDRGRVLVVATHDADLRRDLAARGRVVELAEAAAR